MGGGSGWNPQRGLGISDGQINSCLRDLLRDYNDRDVDAVNQHIETLRNAVEQDGEVIQTFLGGSLRRHTYVEGLSDVDVLMAVNQSSLAGQSPDQAIRYVEASIRQRLPLTEVSAGNLAVTVKFSDGSVIQVLPAIRTDSGIRIANPRENRWSGVIHPERFAQKLTEVNQANQGAVIPAVKLTKVLANRIIQSDRDKISGYHIESLAVEAFRDYPGRHDHKGMVLHLCSYAAENVRQPIRDSTGQSRYVDEYLGAPGSQQRQRAAHYFHEMERRLNGCRSEADVLNLFDH